MRWVGANGLDSGGFSGFDGAGFRCAGPVADLVVVGKIHTMAKPGEVAEGMAVADGKIIFVGSANGAEALLAPHGKIVRLPPDAIGMPGLVDSHVHMLDAGVMRQYCVLDEQESRRRCLRPLWLTPRHIRTCHGCSAADGHRSSLRMAPGRRVAGQNAGRLEHP